MLLFAPTHTLSFALAVARQLGASLATSEEREFDGGEHKIRPLQEVTNHDVFVLQSLYGDAHASVNDKLCRLLFFVGALRDAGAARITACIPYLCYARKDRRTQPRDPITQRYVATLLEAVGVDRVVVLEVHNDAAFDNAFRCPTVRLEASEIFIEPLLQRCSDAPLVIASPDIGGVKRAQRLQQALALRTGSEIDLAFIEKRRSGGVLSGERLIGTVAEREVLIYDDLIASGATLKRAVAACRSAGARRVHVAAAHAAFTSAAAQLFADDGPDSVMVSDSIDLKDHPLARSPRLSVCSAAALFAATIKTQRI